MVELFDYQKEAINYLDSLYDDTRLVSGGILAFQMGMGKTITSLRFSQNNDHILIVCEKSNIQTWITEIEKYSDESYIILHSDYIKEPKCVDVDTYKYIVTTYEFVSSCLDDDVKCYVVKIPQIGGEGIIQSKLWSQRNIDENNDNPKKPTVVKHAVMKNRHLTFTFPNPLMSRKWDIIIADEVTKFVNYKSKISTAMTALVANFYLVLSGTPMLNYSSDLYSIFRFMGYKREKSEFNATSFTEDNLRKHIFTLSYEEANVQMPALIQYVVNVRLSYKEWDIYDKIVEELTIKKAIFDSFYSKFTSDVKDEYSETLQVKPTFMTVLGIYNHLRMFLISPHILTKGEANIDYLKSDDEVMNILNDKTYISSKIMNILLKIDELKHKRILIFSNYVTALDEIKSHIKYFFPNITSDILSGDLNTDKRKKLVDDMNNNKLDILLIQMKVGSTGLNIQNADVVFIVEPAYNVSIENQAIARAYRTGRKKPVEVYRFITEDTFEYQILKIQNRKEELKVTFLGGENKLEKNVTKEMMDWIISQPKRGIFV